MFRASVETFFKCRRKKYELRCDLNYILAGRQHGHLSLCKFFYIHGINLFQLYVLYGIYLVESSSCTPVVVHTLGFMNTDCPRYGIREHQVCLPYGILNTQSCPFSRVQFKGSVCTGEHPPQENEHPLFLREHPLKKVNTPKVERLHRYEKTGQNRCRSSCKTGFVKIKCGKKF